MKRILIVDDDKASLSVLRAILKRSGYKVACAMNGAEALESARLDPPDMVISDILMPRMDGLRLCSELKSDTRLKDVPVVFYTGTYTDPRDEELGSKFGAARYIMKPQKPDDLLSMLHEVLEEHEKRRQPSPVIRGKQDSVLLEEYNMALVRKLEKKVRQLKRTKQRLEKELAERKKLEEVLLKSEQISRLMVSEVKDYAIIMLDSKGSIMSWNEGAQRIKGYTAEEIMGKNFSCFYPEEDIAGGKPDQELKIAKTEGRFEDEGRRVRKDGSRFMANVVITALRDEGGRLIGFSKVTRDITEQKRVEEVLSKRTYNLGKRVKELACLFKISSLIGIPKITQDEILQRVVKLIPPGWQYPEITCARIVMEDGESRTENYKDTDWKIAAEILSSGKRIGSIEVGILEQRTETGDNPFLKEEQDLIKAIARLLGEFTERKRSERELRELSFELEKKVERRTQELKERMHESEYLNQAMVNLLEDLQTTNISLETATRKLEESNANLESFSYSVSHDLRAPLRAIAGFSKILVEDCMESLDAEGQRYLNIIVENINKMGQLIDDLLAFSRLGRKKIELTEIDMNSLARSLFGELTSMVPDRKVQLKIQTLPSCNADKALVKQVLVNLLSNSIKFTRTRDTAIIEVGAGEEREVQVYYVRDNGVGFDKKYMNKLFGVFQRLHRQEDFEGTGVGLAIVQRVIQRHGGRVWAEGDTGKGATFYFTLPARREEELVRSETI